MYCKINKVFVCSLMETETEERYEGRRCKKKKQWLREIEEFSVIYRDRVDISIVVDAAASNIA